MVRIMTKLNELKAALEAKGALPNKDAAGAMPMSPHARPGHRRPEKRRYAEQQVSISEDLQAAYATQGGVNPVPVRPQLHVSANAIETSKGVTRALQVSGYIDGAGRPVLDMKSAKMVDQTALLDAYVAKSPDGRLQPRFAGNRDEHVWRGVLKYHKDFERITDAKKAGWRVVPVTIVEKM